MPFICDIDPELRFKIEVRLDSALLEQELAQLLKNTIAVATYIKKQYDHFMARVGKILGQERIKLVESLDNLFVYLVMMRIRLEKNVSIDSEAIKQPDIKVPIDVRHNKFTIQGKLKRDDLFGMQNFTKGYTVLIFDKIKNILVKYKKVLNGGGFRNDSLQELYCTFDDILYSAIVLRYNLEKCLIDR
jgi:hypothetical protein